MKLVLARVITMCQVENVPSPGPMLTIGRYMVSLVPNELSLTLYFR